MTRVRTRSAIAGSTVALATMATAAQFAPSLARSTAFGDRFAPTLIGRGRVDHVALTFDDGPDPLGTPGVLRRLAELDWRATFFVLGCQATRAPDIVAEVVRAGHEVAVHGYHHRSMARRTPRATFVDIARARDTIAELTGVVPTYFRPPFGILTLAALRSARRAGLTTVLWTNWGRDWRPDATTASIVDDVTRRPLGGATVLLHDSDSQSAPGSWRAVVDALPQLADAFARRGLTVGPLAAHGLRPTATDRSR
jgi:peptidoglycan/xylan/chitin deacetylase (PgdA/CDA1 family)